MRKWASVFLVMVAVAICVALADIGSDVPLRENVWSKVQFISPSEAAAHGGYACSSTGNCTGDANRDDSEGDTDPTCLSRQTEEACKEGEKTVIQYAEVNWCDGWPDGPKSCYYQGEVDCKKEVTCYWNDAAEGCLTQTSHGWSKASEDDCQ